MHCYGWHPQWTSGACQDIWTSAACLGSAADLCNPPFPLLCTVFWCRISVLRTWHQWLWLITSKWATTFHVRGIEMLTHSEMVTCRFTWDLLFAFQRMWYKLKNVYNKFRTVDSKACPKICTGYLLPCEKNPQQIHPHLNVGLVFRRFIHLRIGENASVISGDFYYVVKPLQHVLRPLTPFEFSQSKRRCLRRIFVPSNENHKHHSYSFSFYIVKNQQRLYWFNLR